MSQKKKGLGAVWTHGIQMPVLVRAHPDGPISIPIKEFNAWHSIFHNPDYHPEGDHSLKAHIMDAMRLAWSDFKHNEALPLLADAIMFHDIGKPATMKPNPKTGFNSYIMHEKVGAEIFREDYAKHYTEEEADDLEWVIRQHMNWWVVAKQGKVLALLEHRAFPLLCQLARCDKSGLAPALWEVRMGWFETYREFKGLTA